MSSDPELDRARRYAELVHDGNLDAVQDFFTEDVRWHVAGDSPLSGDHHGRPGLLDHLTAMRASNLRLEPERVIASAGHAAVFTRVISDDEGTVDAVIAEVLESGPDGRWTEYWSVADDQEAIDTLRT